MPSFYLCIVLFIWSDYCLSNYVHTSIDSSQVSPPTIHPQNVYEKVLPFGTISDQLMTCSRNTKQQYKNIYPTWNSVTVNDSLHKLKPCLLGLHCVQVPLNFDETKLKSGHKKHSIFQVIKRQNSEETQVTLKNIQVCQNSTQRLGQWVGR